MVADCIISPQMGHRMVSSAETSSCHGHASAKSSASILVHLSSVSSSHTLTSPHDRIRTSGVCQTGWLSRLGYVDGSLCQRSLDLRSCAIRALEVRLMFESSLSTVMERDRNLKHWSFMNKNCISNHALERC